jgi:predicted nucleotidyltransferase
MQFDDKIKDIVDDKIGLKNVVLISYRGSIVHNMYIPNTDPNSIDDVDVMVVYLKDPKYYLSLASGFEKGKDIKVGEYDFAMYEFKKFVYLLYKSNPNVLTTLWLNDEHYIYKDSDPATYLLSIRDEFISKKVYSTFAGYANGQLKRMEHFQFKGFMGERRKQLVRKFGFDTKNAAHLIRLLRMGKEALETGKLNVFRHDAEELLQIKKGEWSLDRVKDESDRLFKDLKKACDESTLKDEPNKEKIEKVLFTILYSYINNC